MTRKMKQKGSMKQQQQNNKEDETKKVRVNETAMTKQQGRWKKGSTKQQQ